MEKKENNSTPGRGRVIAVLGAGNLGPAMAGHMAMNGYEVRLGNRTAARLDTVKANGLKIKISGPIVSGDGQLAAAGGLDEFEQVVSGAEMVMITVPATGQEAILKAAMPFLRPDAHVVLHPGQLFGAFAAKKQLMEFEGGKLAGVTVSEIESSQLTCRATTAADVSVFAIKAKLGIATMPRARNKDVVGFLSPLYGETLFPRDNILLTGFYDFNLLVHPLVVMLNTAAIENRRTFLFYQEGVSTHVGRLLEKADDERMRIGKALGLDLETLLEWFLDEYAHVGARGNSVYEAMTSCHAYDDLKSPTKLYTRYIWEDIPDGLIGLIELGEQLGVEIKVLPTVYNLACLMFDRDWQDEKRTCSTLGLGELSAEQLVHYAETCEMPPQ